MRRATRLCSGAILVVLGRGWVLSVLLHCVEGSDPTCVSCVSRLQAAWCCGAVFRGVCNAELSRLIVCIDLRVVEAAWL